LLAIDSKEWKDIVKEVCIIVQEQLKGVQVGQLNDCCLKVGESQGLVGDIHVDKNYLAEKRRKSVQNYLASKPAWSQRLEANTSPFNNETFDFITEMIGARLQNAWNRKFPTTQKNPKFIQVLSLFIRLSLELSDTVDRHDSRSPISRTLVREAVIG